MKAVIFDMDGVLILTEKMAYKGFADVCRRHGHELSLRDYNDYFSGTRNEEAFEGFLKSKNADTYAVNQMADEFRAIKRELLTSRLKEVIILREGTKEMLERVKQAGYKTAIATSTVREFTEMIVNGLGLRKYFEKIITGNDVSRGKPDPEVYLLAAELLRAEPGECVVVEDAQNGIKSAKNAGMACIAVRDRSFGERDISLADHVIERFSEITPELIEELIAKGKAH
ncbi:MAG TPA: HAD family phosphatase [Candidatus Woesearchaeota archaeon]|nr:HAD family phosphatase [Candidatus Woesearchaeota archaeon]